MGFYGNITNTSKTNFVFDKIYTNRKAMDDNAANDGVFIGRHVLVEYGQITKETFTRVYKKDGTTNFYLDSKYEIDLEYTSDGVVKNDQITKDMVVYIITANEQYEYYKCTGGTQSNKPRFQKVDTETITQDPYFFNLNQDRGVIGYIGKGYDSTVWVKASIDGNIKYVNIAELNSVVPSFELIADAPTTSPLTPHFDTSNTNILYKLHWQPSWGMRIAAATDESKSDYNTEWKRVKLNAQGELEEEWYNPTIEGEGSKWQKESYNQIPADIYFNRAGFDPKAKGVKTDDDNSNNYISITPDGESGNLYNSHNGEGLDSKPDTQQLHIYLPAIGNMMSDAWDIIHGVDRDDYQGQWKKDENTGEYLKDGNNNKIDFSSLKGRLDSIAEFSPGQIPYKSSETGQLIGVTINGDNPIAASFDNSKNEIVITHNAPNNSTTEFGVDAYGHVVNLQQLLNRLQGLEAQIEELKGAIGSQGEAPSSEGATT